MSGSLSSQGGFFLRLYVPNVFTGAFIPQPEQSEIPIDLRGYRVIPKANWSYAYAIRDEGFDVGSFLTGYHNVVLPNGITMSVQPAVFDAWYNSLPEDKRPRTAADWDDRLEPKRVELLPNNTFVLVGLNTLRRSDPIGIEHLWGLSGTTANRNTLPLGGRYSTNPGLYEPPPVELLPQSGDIIPSIFAAHILRWDDLRFQTSTAFNVYNLYATRNILSGIIGHHVAQSNLIFKVLPYSGDLAKPGVAGLNNLDRFGALFSGVSWGLFVPEERRNLSSFFDYVAFGTQGIRTIGNLTTGAGLRAAVGRTKELAPYIGNESAGYWGAVGNLADVTQLAGNLRKQTPHAVTAVQDYAAYVAQNGVPDAATFQQLFPNLARYFTDKQFVPGTQVLSILQDGNGLSRLQTLGLKVNSEIRFNGVPSVDTWGPFDDFNYRSLFDPNIAPLTHLSLSPKAGSFNLADAANLWSQRAPLAALLSGSVQVYTQAHQGGFDTLLGFRPNINQIAFASFVNVPIRITAGFVAFSNYSTAGKLWPYTVGAGLSITANDVFRDFTQSFNRINFGDAEIPTLLQWAQRGANSELTRLVSFFDETANKNRARFNEFRQLDEFYGRQNNISPLPRAQDYKNPVQFLQALRTWAQTYVRHLETPGVDYRWTNGGTDAQAIKILKDIIGSIDTGSGSVQEVYNRLQEYNQEIERRRTWIEDGPQGSLGAGGILVAGPISTAFPSTASPSLTFPWDGDWSNATFGTTRLRDFGTVESVQVRYARALEALVSPLSGIASGYDATLGALLNYAPNDVVRSVSRGVSGALNLAAATDRLVRASGSPLPEAALIRTAAPFQIISSVGTILGAVPGLQVPGGVVQAVGTIGAQLAVPAPSNLALAGTSLVSAIGTLTGNRYIGAAAQLGTTAITTIEAVNSARNVLNTALTLNQQVLVYSDSGRAAVDAAARATFNTSFAASIAGGVGAGLTVIGGLIGGTAGRVVSSVGNVATIVSGVLASNPITAILGAVGLVLGLFGGIGARPDWSYRHTDARPDLDGDGQADLVTRTGDNRIKVQISGRDNSQREALDLGGKFGSNGMAGQDVYANVDGNPGDELIWQDPENNYFHIYRYNNSTGRFDSNPLFVYDHNLGRTQGLGRFSDGRLRLLFGDMDGDGDLEAQFFKDGKLAWVGFNPGWGDFASPQNPNLPVEQRGHTPISFANAQALIQASTEAATAVGLAEASAGAPTTAQLRAIAASTPGVSVHPWTQFRSGDLNGNGQLDVVIAQAGANTVQVRFDDSGWLAPQQTNFWNADFNRGWKVDWDYNFDGRTDLLYSGRLQDWEETWNEPSYATINGKRFYDTRFLALSRGDGSFGRLGDGRGLDTWRIGRDDNNDGVVRSGEYGFEGLTLLRGLHDVNGDGRTDVLFRMTDNSVGVWLTRADGGFQTISWWRHGSGEVSAALTPSLGKALRGDVTGDGIADSLWIAGDGKVHVAPGLWNGTFGEIVTSQTRSGWPFGAAADSFSFVDFNLDGRLDLLSGAYGWGTLHLGRADGSFAPELLLWRPDNASYRWWEHQANLAGLAGADLNGDGRADAIQYENGRYSVFLQQSDGTFAWALGGGWNASDGNWKARGTFSVAQLAGEAFRGDVNGDGIADAVWRDGWNRFWVARGRNGGGFETAVVTEHSNFGTLNDVWVDYRDLNLDGRLDVVMTSKDSLYSAIAFGQANGTLGFTASTTVWTRTEGVNRNWWENQDNIRRLAGTDVNGDGRADAIQFDNGRYNVWLQQFDGSFASALGGGWDANAANWKARGTFSVAQLAGEAFRGDVNGDGIADAVWRDGWNRFWVARGRNGGGFETAVVTEHSNFSRFGDDTVRYLDYNLDGRLDAMMTSADGRFRAVAFGQANGTLGFTDATTIWQRTEGVERNWWENQVNLRKHVGADVNGDGRADAIQFDNGGYNVWLQQSNGTFALALGGGWDNNPPKPTAEQVFGQRFSLDLDGDGYSDKLWRTAQNGFVVSWGIGGDRFSDPISLVHGRSIAVAAYTELEISFGDVDGDGDSDLLWSNRSTGEAWLQRAGSNLRSSGYSDIVSLGSAGASRQAELSDLNGDGRADLVRVTRATPPASGTGDVTQITVAFGRNDGSFGETITSATISGAPLIGQAFSGDINGDGRADTVFRDPLNRLWITLGRTTGATDPTLHTTLLPSASALPNGAGDPFANGTFALGDIDGDGRSDLFFTLNSGETWVRRGQADGTFSATASVAGSLVGGTGAALLRDVNGDGRADLVRLVRGTDGGVTAASTSFGQADGTFGTTVTGAAVFGMLPAITGPANISLSGTLALQFLRDVNGDGRADLVARGVGGLHVALGQTDGTFAAATLATGIAPEEMAFSAASLGDIKGDLFELITGDFDGDGRTDFIRLNKGTPTDTARVMISLSRGNGVFETGNLVASVVGDDGTTRVQPVWPDFRADLMNMFVGDFNGDGVDDFIRQEKSVWDDDEANTANIYLGQRNGTFVARSIAGAQWLKGDFTNLLVGDFNGDGRDDFIRQEKNGWDSDNINTLQLYLGQADGTFTVQNLSDTLQLKGSQFNLQIGDFNGDGKSDLLSQRRSDSTTRASQIYVASTNTAGHVAFSAWGSAFGNDATLHRFSIGDFDGDGRDDLIVQETGAYDDDDIWTAAISRAGITGLGTWNLLTDYTAMKGDLTRLVIADFNGDGVDDFLRQENGVWDDDDVNTANLYLANGDGTFRESRNLAFAASLKGDFTRVVAGDFDGDGASDFIRQEYGAWDDDSANTTTLYTAAPRQLTYDVEGDGDLDRFVVTKDAVFLYVRTAEGYGTPIRLGIPAGETRFFAAANRRIDVADVNGDGVADLISTSSTGVAVGLGYARLSGNTVSDAGFLLGERFVLDLDGDGDVDTLLRDGTNNLWFTEFRNGTALAPVQVNGLLPVTGTAGFQALSMQFADLNGDSRADLLIGHRDGRIWLRFGQAATTENGNAFFSNYADLDRDGTSNDAVGSRFGGGGAAELIDFNGDGRLDLRRTRRDASGAPVGFTLALGLGNGTFGASIGSVVRNGQVTLGDVFSADINGDGRLDSVYRDSGNTVWVALRNANGSFAAQASIASAVPASSLGVSYGVNDVLSLADIDGDLRADLIWVKADASGKATGALTVLRSSGTADVPAFTAIDLNGGAAGVANSTTGEASLADLNGDGRTDLIRTTYDTLGNVSARTLALGQSDGTFGSAQNLTLETWAGSNLADSLSATNTTAPTLWRLLGSAGNDTLTGGSWSDTLAGGADNDSLAGGAGDDLLVGEGGADTLVGGAGSDLYGFGFGSGQDRVVESGGTRDTIAFDQSVGLANLRIQRSDTDLRVGLASSTDASFASLADTLTLVGQVGSDTNVRVERLAFADGAQLDLVSLVQAMAGFGLDTGAEISFARSDVQQALRPVLLASSYS